MSGSATTLLSSFSSAMFFSLAWLRAFFAFSLLVLANAQHEDSIFTSSVTYCNPPESLLISRFEVAYFPHNQSVAFNLSAASVQPNVSVNANLMLNVYGMKPVNLTLDLCNILGGALCPLPRYNFTGADTITLPSSIDVTGRIPGIAFTIPDLEGFAQLTLTEVGTGAVKACVQATLANGWSAHQKAVEWTTGGVAIAAAVVSFFVSMLVADALAPVRFLDLMLQYQFIASSALLSLNYPSVYRAFALNFSWALGLFPASETSAIQNSINSFRHRTGGRLADASQGAAVQFVDRKLSPYNNVAVVEAASAARGALSALVSRDEIANISSSLGSGFPGKSFLARQTIQGEVQTVTTNSSNVLAGGLPIYVNSVNVATSNAFMTVFLTALMLFAIGLAVLSVGFVIYLSTRSIRRKRDTDSSSFDYLAFSRGWILRLSLICLTPLLIFIFYQWTLKDSWASILLSVLTFVALILLIGWPVFTTMRLGRSKEYDLHAHNNGHLQANAPLYAHYRPERYWFFLVGLAAVLLRSIFIAFARYNARVQIALVVLLEGLVVIAYFVLKPYPTRGRDVFSTYLAISRFATAVLLIVFLENLAVKPIPRVAIGLIIVAVNSVAVVVIIINFVLNLFALFVPRLLQRKRSGSQSQSSGESQSSRSDGSTLEKGLINVENRSVDSSSPRP